MCYDDDSSPPIPPISGASVRHEDLVLDAPDGNRFGAFLAIPEEELGAGVVILPDVRGLHRFYEELALRFAEAGSAAGRAARARPEDRAVSDAAGRGIVALAFDYFGRTAGLEKRPNDWDYMPLVQQLTMEQVQTDVGTCVAHLSSMGADPIFTVGFCYGGSGSWAAAASGHGLAGAIGFYGRPGRMIDLVPQLEAPILALQGGDDPGIPHEDNVEFERVLHENGKDYELVEFEGAPHSFFDRKQEEFQAASDQAWQRTLDFIAAHS